MRSRAKLVSATAVVLTTRQVGMLQEEWSVARPVTGPPGAWGARAGGSGVPVLSETSTFGMGLPWT